uniref:Fungal lipase-type domain-containing protein n=1 Tax=Daucus carota subsp. sativus TaxID=79200 RepID=A0A166HAY7_DAUCS
MKRFLSTIDFRLGNNELSRRSVYNVIARYQSQGSSIEKMKASGSDDGRDVAKVEKKTGSEWNVELDWFSKTLEPALQMLKRALPAGNVFENKPPPSSRTVSEIISSIQRSKIGVQDWCFSDLTLGLYLLYLRQASTEPFQDVKGVEDLIYHTELAKGAYKDSVASIAKNTMLRESNVLKFVKNSSVLRPGYYIGVDMRKKLVILGIRGTHTVQDLITDVVSSSHEEVLSEGFSTHFGSAEAAGWFLSHELGTVKKCLEQHQVGFRLRLVGHSLGGATASLLAIMMRRKSSKQLGFSPDSISAVGYGTPPCVSREIADGCSDYVRNVVMQIALTCLRTFNYCTCARELFPIRLSSSPELNPGNLVNLGFHCVGITLFVVLNRMGVLEKEDWRSVTDLVTNAKQVVTSVQDVARKLADYAKLSNSKFLEIPARKDSLGLPSVPATAVSSETVPVLKKKEDVSKVPDELFVPGTVYCLKRHVDTDTSTIHGKAADYFTLWKRHPGEHFQKILLSSNILSDHKCDNHYYALRDVLKGLPGSR